MSSRRIKVMSTLFLLFSLCFRKMNASRTPTRRVESNEMQEEIPLQVEEVEQVSQGDQVPIVGGGDDVPG